MVFSITSGTNSNGDPGFSFALRAWIRNDGDAESDATPLHFYSSKNTTITTSDTSVGTDAVDTLVPSGGYGATIKLTAPSTAGTYYYGGGVDAVPRESD